MPQNNAVSRQRLDRPNSIRAEKPLKAIQLALTFQHQSNDLAFRR
jgi:hypothetical protein